MNEVTLVGWKNLAIQRIDLRYPKIDLMVYPPNSIGGIGTIMLTTLIHNKDKSRLVLIDDTFKYNTSTDIWDILDKFKQRFISRCELNKESYIFNKETSVYEPYGR